MFEAVARRGPRIFRRALFVITVLGLVLVARVSGAAGETAATHNEAGKRLLSQQRWQEAASEFRASLNLNPRQADTEISLGIALWGARDRRGAEEAFHQATALDPASADAHFNLAVAFRDLGEIPKALAEVKAALKFRPDYEAAEVALGLLLQQSGEADAAIAQYRQTLRRHPQSADAHNWLGVAYLQKNRLADAEAEFRAAIKLNPSYVRAYNNLGTTLTQGGDVAAGISILREGLKQAPDNGGLKLNLGMALKSGGKPEEAIQLFQSLVNEHPEDSSFTYQLGQTFRQSGDLAGAIREFQKALDRNGELRDAYYALASALRQEAAALRRERPGQRSPANSQAATLCKEGQAELARGGVQRAAAILRQAVDSDSGDAEAHNLLGFALGRSGKLPEALTQLHTAISLDPNLAEAHYNLGVALWYAGNRSEAKAELERSVALDPASANASSFLGMVYREGHDLQNSRHMFQRAIALNPNASYPYFDLAVIFLREGRLDAGVGQLESGLNLGAREGPIPDLELAVTELRKALAANPANAEAHNTLGRILGLAGVDEQQVISAFLEAIRLQPDFAEAHNNLGLVYTQAGDDVKAAAEFREAIRLLPEFTEAHQNLGTLLITSDPPQAVHELQRALELKPGLLNAEYNLALAYDANPSDGMATEIEQLRKVIAAEPKYPHAEFALGKAMLKSGNTAEAIGHLQSAVKNEPEFGQAYYQLGLALARAGRKTESAEAMEKSRTFVAASEREENGNLDLRQGRAALEAGKIDEAQAMFERLVGMWPESPQGNYYLGMVQKQKGDAANAAASFRRVLELKPGYLDAKAQLASLQSNESDQEQEAIEGEVKQGNFPEAERRLRSYLDLHPKSSWGWYALGYCFYGNHKLGESIRALAQSLQLNVKNAEAHKVLGRDMMMIGRFDAAQTEFEQGRRYEPKSAEMPYNLGKLYSIQDNWPLAKKSFEQAITLDPDFMEAYDGLGLALESLGDKEGAIERYNKAIDLNEARRGHFGAAYVNMSALHNAAGDSKKALEFAQLGLFANPGSDRALYQMAKAYERDGAEQQAIDCLHRAIEINPNASAYFYLLATTYRRSGKMNDSRKAMASFTKLNNLTNELEQKRINWFKEEGAQVQLLQRPVGRTNN